MAIPSSLTLQFGTLLSTTLMKWQQNIADQVASGKAFYFILRKRGSSGWRELDSIGERARMPLRHKLATADSYSGLQPLPVDPTDPLTTAFYDWGNASTPLAVSGDDLAKNKGREQMIDLMKSVRDAAVDGLIEFFSEAVMRGQGRNDTTSITTAYTSPNNASTFVEPIGKIISKDVTSSVSIGNIDQSLHTFWRNKVIDASTYKTGPAAIDSFSLLETAVEDLRAQCSERVGGPPDLHATDRRTWLTYGAGLRARYRTNNPMVGDLPFENYSLAGKPVVWDEHLPDFGTGSTTQLATSGSWLMINTKFFMIQVEKANNFTPGEMQRPINQDGLISQVLWRGALTCNARNKQGMLHTIDNTGITS